MHPFRWDSTVEAELRSCAERVERLRQHELAPAAVQSLREWFRIHHTFHSNAIEGNRLSLAETRAVVEHGITIAGKPLKDHTEAVNLAHAVDYVEKLASAHTTIGESDLRTIHELVLRGLSSDGAGAYRRIPVRISGSDHVPPSPGDVAPQMQQLSTWLAAPEPSDPILRASIAHAWFERIHPFVDGNGRTGRLLANLILIRAGYPVTVLRVEERARYYDALAQADGGNLTPLVRMTARLVAASLSEYERITGDLQAREPELTYLAERLDEVRELETPEFLIWRERIASLQVALDRAAAEIRSKQKEHRISLEWKPMPLPTSEAVWRAFIEQRQLLAVLRVRGPSSESGTQVYAMPAQQFGSSGGPEPIGALEVRYSRLQSGMAPLPYAVPVMAAPETGSSHWAVGLAEPELQRTARSDVTHEYAGLRQDVWSTERLALMLWRVSIDAFFAETMLGIDRR